MENPQLVLRWTPPHCRICFMMELKKNKLVGWFTSFCLYRGLSGVQTFALLLRVPIQIEQFNSKTSLWRSWPVQVIKSLFVLVSFALVLNEHYEEHKLIFMEMSQSAWLLKLSCFRQFESKICSPWSSCLRRQHTEGEAAAAPSPSLTEARKERQKYETLWNSENTALEKKIESRGSVKTKRFSVVS